MSALEPVFHGWNSALLPKFVKDLLAQHGPDLGDFTIALPGRRAGRRLLELLVAEAPPAWTPPRILTLAQLSDQLTRWPLPRADDSQRELAWLAALRATPRRAWETTLLPDPPPADDAAAWLPLVEMMRQLHAQLAAEGWDFAAVAREAETRNRAAWELLAQVQEGYAARLAANGTGDPHLMRLTALAESQFQPLPGPLLLVGVVEANRLQRRILAAAPLTGQVHLASPEEHAAGFDAWGFPLPDYWAEQALEVPAAQLELCLDSDQQADRVMAALHEAARKHPAEDISLGLLAADSLPRVASRLAQQDVELHLATGTPMSRTGPFRLLESLRRWLIDPGEATLGALLRHPDLEQALAREMEHAPTPAALDRYLADHVPAAPRPPWLESKSSSGRVAAANLSTQSALLWHWTTALREERHSPVAWVPILEQVLLQVHGEEELDRSKEGDRRTAAALETLAGILARWRHLPESGATAPALRGAEALACLLAELRREEASPPRRRIPSVDAVGWLELALDDAPALIVTDLQEGLVPRPPAWSPLLDEELRHRLGLEQDAARLARDQVILMGMIASRRNSGWPRLLHCRSDADGTPRRPSRLLFRGPREERIARAVEAFAQKPDARTATTTGLPAPKTWPGPGLEGEHDAATFSCSRLNRYLASPYAYFLREVLRLEDVDEAPRELDALHFGSLLHAVLEAYGRDPAMRQLEDPEAIHAATTSLLAAEAAARFGSPTRGTVALQLKQAEHRLLHFAQDQAQEMAQGWRIHAVEWSPTAGPVPLTMGGVDFRLRGIVDRIDRREVDGRVEWRILDYKTADRPYDKKRCVGSRTKRWADVQLALYPALTAETTGPPRLEVGREDLQVGYWNLGIGEGREHGITRIEFDEEERAALHEQVGDAVRGIRAEDFFDPAQKPPPYDDFVLRCMGRGLLVRAEEDLEVES